MKFECSRPLRDRGEIETLMKDRYQAVFLGIGLWEPVRLTDERDSGEDVYPSIRFLEAFRQGKAKDLGRHCKGKVVAVVGGGSVAIDCARVAKKLGAADVYLVYRRAFEQMPAEADERAEALAEGIHFLLLNQPQGYVRDGKGNLTGLQLVRTRLGAEDASGRRKPVEIPGSDWVLEAQTVVEAIGNQAPAESPDWYPRVKVSGMNLVVADAETGRTSFAGVFAGGDIVRGPATVVEAIADGKAAAKAITEYLTK